MADSPTFSPSDSFIDRELELLAMEGGAHEQGGAFSYSPWPDREEIPFWSNVDHLPENIAAADHQINIPATNVFAGTLVGGNDQLDMARSNQGEEEKIDDDQEQQKVARNHSSSISKKIIIKEQWTSEEDSLLVQLVKKFGLKRWAFISKRLNGRNGKQCRERWYNQLRPDIKKFDWTEEEEQQLVEAHKIYGNRWAEIARHMPGRSENFIKNRWNATKRKEDKTKVTPSKAPILRPSILQDYIRSKTCNHSSNSIPSAPMTPPATNLLIQTSSSFPTVRNDAMTYTNNCTPYLYNGVQDVQRLANILVEGSASSPMPDVQEERINNYISYLLEPCSSKPPALMAGVLQASTRLSAMAVHDGNRCCACSKRADRYNFFCSPSCARGHQ